MASPPGRLERLRGPATRLVLGLAVLGMAGLLISAGMTARLIPLILDLARAHAGAITLAVAAVLLLTAANHTRP